MWRGRQVYCGSGYSQGTLECIRPAFDRAKTAACPNDGNGSRQVFGNPCDASSGNKFEVEVDYQGPGAFPLVFRRTYNSYGYDAMMSSVGVIGRNWRHSYSSSVTEVTTSSGDTRVTRIAVKRPDGATYFFAQVNGVWVTDTDIEDALVETADGWTYTTRDGTVETYESLPSGVGVRTGRLASITDRAGLTQTMAYDSEGRLAQVTDAFGRSLRLAYDAKSGLATLTTPDNQVIQYVYDTPNSHLTKVIYQDLTAKLYHFEAGVGLLTGISYDNGAGTVTRLSTYGYNAYTKQVTSTQHAGGQEKFTLNYDTALQTTVTDAVNNKEVLTFATNLGAKLLTVKKNLVDNKTISQTFDPNNNLTCRQDEEGRVTTWTYNATNQKLSETSGRTGTCTSPVTTSATRTTTYGYLNPNLDLPTVIESPSVGGGSLKKRTEITYDPTLKVPRVITQRGYTPAGLAVSRTVTLDYNASGQVKTIDGPRTDVADITTLDYYECTTGGTCGQLKRVTNALGQATTYDVYDANGRLIEMTDPNGLKTTYGYDLRGRVLSVSQRAADGTTRLTGYQYDAAGNVTEVRTPDGRLLTYTFDAAQYLRTVTDNAGNKVEYSYDLKGNRTATKTYDPQGTLVRSIELAFDARNRVSEVNDGGSITKQVWDAVGNLTKVTDPNTVAAAGTTATVNEYDALNRLFKTTDRLTGLTQVGYDSSDRVKQVTAPNTATTGYAVDDLGNVLKETSPDRGVLTYGYDQAGNVTGLLDARGITVSYVYDALNRLTQVDVPGTAEDVSYTYDSAPGCTQGIGRLCQVRDASGTSAYAYDGFGNLTAHTRTELGATYTTHYGYDALNRVAAITYPDGRKVDYTRNALGQVTAVTLTANGTAQTLASNIAYRADGLLSGLTYGNGLSESRLYSLAGRLTSWTVGGETRTFLYDANGNLKEKTGTATATFGYDALDRLKDESLNGFAQGFTYDPNGNRTSDGLGSYDYLAQSNRLTATPTGAITLDAAGNLTHQGARTFGYTGSGQLKDITEGTLLAAYAYNGERQRTQKTVNNDTTVYHYDLTGNLLMETDATGTPKRAYVWVNGRPLAQLDSSGIVYLHTDQLDTPRLATNAQGTVVWRWEGEAFGDSAPNEDPDQDGSLTTVNLRFPGQYYDAESGLHYNWNRYYDPKIGRYVTSDPIGLRGGLNTYSYAESSPVKLIDPLGLSGVSGSIGGSGFVGTIGGSGASGVVFGDAGGTLNVCYQSVRCARLGAGLSFQATVQLGYTSGALCSGESNAAGVFAQGVWGAGLAGAGSYRVSENGSASLGSGNIGPAVGWGGAAGIEGCHVVLICANDPPCCRQPEGCKSCGSTGNISDIVAP